MSAYSRTDLGHGSPSQVILFESTHVDLVMLCEARLRWAGIPYSTQCRARAAAAAGGSDRVAPMRVRVAADRLHEARRLLVGVEDDSL